MYETRPSAKSAAGDLPSGPLGLPGVGNAGPEFRLNAYASTHITDAIVNGSSRSGILPPLDSEHLQSTLAPDARVEDDLMQDARSNP